MARNLDPILSAAAAVARIGELGDDAFRLQQVCLLPDYWAIAFDVVAEIEALRGPLEQLTQQRLTLQQRQAAHIVATVKEDVEGAELQRFGIVARDGLGERAEIGSAIGTGHHHLAVNNEITT